MSRRLRPASSVCLDGEAGAAAGIGLDAFATAPENEYLCAEFRAEIHGAHGFLQGVGADFGIVGGEGSVAKDGVIEQRDCGHGNDDAVIGAGLTEFLDDAIAFGRCGVDGDEIVVVEIDAPRARVREQLHRVDGRQEIADGLTEGIAAAIADGPETKGELV